jgi:LPS O-antigen subunit length determinant protein (WzzB/FepE family)
MKKKLNDLNDEINLILIINTFWKKKIIIILIILVSVIIGIGLDNIVGKKKGLFEGSFQVSKSSNSEFSIFYPINKFLSEFNIKTEEEEVESFLIINGETSLSRFVEEFTKKELLLSEIKKIKFIRDEISSLQEKDQQSKILSYLNLFSIHPITSPNRIIKYNIIFKWHDPEEGKKILIQVIEQLSNKIYKTVINDMENAVLTAKNYVKIKDLKRIEFLKEQYEIAQVLGIETFRNDQIIFNNLDQSNFNLENHDYNNYFLRGKTAIAREIKIIEDRQYVEFAEIEKYLNNLNSADLKIKWVNQNPYLINTRQINDSKNYLRMLIILGMVVAFLYGILSHAYKRAQK